jgi:hypothetical protein
VWLPQSEAGGYLLVIQFQDLAYWGGHASTGKRGRGPRARCGALADPSRALRSRHRPRALIMFLAAIARWVMPTLCCRVAALIYGKPPRSVRVAQ